MDKETIKKKCEAETCGIFFIMLLFVNGLFWYAPVQSEAVECPYCQNEFEVDWGEDWGDKWQCIYCGCLNGSDANKRPRRCLCCGRSQ